MSDHNPEPMNKEELEKYIEKDFLPSLLSKLPIMSKHDNDTCPHLVRASLLEAENARLKAEVERLRSASFVTAVPVEQYERLVKAGDACADAAYAHCMCQDCEELRDQWRDAKRGKPSV